MAPHYARFSSDHARNRSPERQPGSRSAPKENILEFTRGAVRILNRKKLEACSCECYGAIQQFNGELGLKEAGRIVGANRTPCFINFGETYGAII
jgi:hypothetical protein